jgi:hypothetical protein
MVAPQVREPALATASASAMSPTFFVFKKYSVMS